VIRLPMLDRGQVAAAAAAAAEVLAAGGAVVVPTETFYGLAADCRSERAVARVFELKGRPRGVPLPVLCADWRQLEELAEVPEGSRRKLSRIWPGALTVVLRARSPLPVAGSGTVAVRIPGHPELRAVLYRTGPVTGTSANRHGWPPSVALDDAVASLASEPELALDGGRCPGGAASTLVDLTGDLPQVLRAGPVEWFERYPLDGNHLPP